MSAKKLIKVRRWDSTSTAAIEVTSVYHWNGPSSHKSPGFFGEIWRIASDNFCEREIHVSQDGFVPPLLALPHILQPMKPNKMARLTNNEIKLLHHGIRWREVCR